MTPELSHHLKLHKWAGVQSYNIKLILVMTDLEFDDEAVLLSEVIDQAQELLNRVETSGAKNELNINPGRTKYNAFNHLFNTSVRYVLCSLVRE